MRSAWIVVACGLACIGFFGSRAFAEAAKTGEANAPTPCFEVEVNGERAPSYECLTQKLRPAPSAGGAAPTPALMGSEAIVQRPSNQLGLFNRQATANRMGNTFGTSVYPQRPPGVPTHAR
jgi:hypothetical protein